MGKKTILGGCVEICHRSKKNKNTEVGITEIYPAFRVIESSDLMIRGGDFYAVWVESRKLWSKKKSDLIAIIDGELSLYADEYRKHCSPDEIVLVLYVRNAETGMIDQLNKYCKQQALEYYRALDEKLIFANDETTKEDYATKKLPYALSACETPAYDRLMGVLYSDEERHKLEWAIGSIVAGESKHIQKFVALYGAGGTGKSTVLRIINQLFEGYCATFDAKALGSGKSDFALEAFRNNPLVAIEDDAKLDKIEDNTRLNSLISHEMMLVNEKFKSQYENSFHAFIFVGTNTPIRITDAKSGLIRRLIDVSPTNDKVTPSEYFKLKKQIGFELGGIAHHCLEVFQANPEFYDHYIPKNMMGASNDFYNFVAYRFFEFKENDGTTLTAAWKMWKEYVDMANIPDKMSMTKFREELKNYFHEFQERSGVLENGKRLRSYYSGFRYDIFEPTTKKKDEEPVASPLLRFGDFPSAFDALAADWPAQYGTAKETPIKKWAEVTTTLRNLDTSKLHYVKVPENHIVIDFDIPDENGKKSLEKNLEEASKWPPTYAELSKSGKGIHLHYIYDGDPEQLAKEFAPHIEIKVFTGNSSLRRKLNGCTALTIAHIGAGLPLKGEKPPMVNMLMIRSEQGIRRMIERCLRREIHPNTKPSIDMINKVLEDAYAAGIQYNVCDMKNAVFGFAASSTHQSDYCLKLAANMKFKSENPIAHPQDEANQAPVLVFFDCEVFPNLLVICWKFADTETEKHEVQAMINPSPQEVEDFIDNFNLVGFNNRKYDNHIIYARSTGMSVEDIYKLSDSMINKKTGFIPSAYDISYTDIYDFSSKKQSLKKFEIELGIDHKELDIPWNEKVPEDLWETVVDYCKNDVVATEKTFKARRADFVGREVLAKLANGTPNDTTNSLTAKYIFQGDRNPQEQFNYRFMGDIPEKVYRSKADAESGIIYHNLGDEYTLFDEQGRPVFPGYEFKIEEVDKGTGVPVKLYKSTYRGEEVGEGGYVYAEPGMYTNVWLFDISSQHPTSAIEEQLFGEYYTKRFKEIRDARFAIKRKDFEQAKTLLNGELTPYLNDPDLLDGLKQALKIMINSVYGLTSAKFANPFRDPRNVDNIVAKRGALFMINLKHEVQKRGFTVAHIKTDSIKVPNATPEIAQFIIDYGAMYGYEFVHEAIYERMCLVNDAVYIAKFDTAESAKAKCGYVPVDLEKDGGKWTATGTQFAVPFVFKSLFTHDPIEFDDLCETKSVTSALYLDMNEGLPAGEHLYHFVGRVGRFCPIKPGYGGGELLRQTENKKTGEKGYASATGAKGWRWLEAETVKVNGWTDRIDRGYYEKLADEAAKAIGKYCDVEWFCNGLPEQPIPYDEMPPWDFEEPADMFNKR